MKFTVEYTFLAYITYSKLNNDVIFIALRKHLLIILLLLVCGYSLLFRGLRNTQTFEDKHSIDVAQRLILLVSKNAPPVFSNSLHRGLLITTKQHTDTTMFLWRVGKRCVLRWIICTCRSATRWCACTLRLPSEHH